MAKRSDQGGPPRPRWLYGEETNRDDATRHERSVATKIRQRYSGRLRSSAHVRPGSGSHPLGKGDVVTWDDLGECKTTKAQSITLKQAWLAKIEREAQDVGRDPFLHIEFQSRRQRVTGDAGMAEMTLGWVVIPEWLFLELLEARNAARHE